MSSSYLNIQGLFNVSIIPRFVTRDPETGALQGPFAPLLYLPFDVAANFFRLAASLRLIPSFPIECREIAILTVGEYYGSDFELYSHTRVAQKATMLSNRHIREILDGREPKDCTEQERTTWEISRALLRADGKTIKGSLEPSLWERAVLAFGKVGAQALIHYVGAYAYTCILLNGCAVEVPKGEKVLPDLQDSKA